MLHLFHSEQAVKEAQLKAFLAFQISVGAPTVISVSVAHVQFLQAIAPSPEATRSRMLSKKNLAHLLLKRIARALHKFKGPEEGKFTQVFAALTSYLSLCVLQR